MRKEAKVVRAKEDAWNDRDKIAQDREKKLLSQAETEREFLSKERLDLVQSHINEKKKIRGLHQSEIMCLNDAHKKEIERIKISHKEAMKREKDLYNEDVKQLKLELEAKKKDLDKTRKILEDRITRADNIFERLKALSLMLHIKQRESIEVLKDFNIQATKLSRHGDSLEEIVKYAEKLGKDFKELKRITKD